MGIANDEWKDTLPWPLGFKHDEMRRSEVMNDQPLNAAQMAAVQKAVGEFVKDMKIRQWCVEQSVDVCNAANSHATGAPFNDPVRLAEGIYKFITTGAR